MTEDNLTVSEAATLPPVEPTASKPVAEAAIKPTKVARTKEFLLDSILASGVFVFGGLFALLGLRKISLVRLAVEVLIISLVLAGAYYGLAWSFPGSASAFSIDEPLHRAIMFFLAALVFEYVGGLVVYRGWKYAGDPKVGMLILALGVGFLGIRVAGIGMMVGEIRVATARVVVGEASHKSFDATVAAMKEAGIDPKPMGAIIHTFMDDVYGPNFGVRMRAMWTESFKPKPLIVDVPDGEGKSADAATPPLDLYVPDNATGSSSVPFTQ